MRDDYAHAATADPKGNIIVIGTLNNGHPVEDNGSASDAVVAKFPAEGSKPRRGPQWMATHDTNHGSDRVTAVTCDKDGNVIIAGWSQYGKTKPRIFVIKYPP
jgi:hypothetical protein